jgi:hypothetical protein
MFGTPLCNFEALSTSRARGCKFCTIIENEILRVGPTPPTAGFFWTKGRLVMGHHKHVKFEIFAKQDTPLSPPFPDSYDFHPYVRVGGHPLGDTGSSEASALIQTWIVRCQRDHPTCDGWSAAELPDRVLDVGSLSNSEVRLLEDTNSLGRRLYACLSHRWNSQTENFVLRRIVYGNSCRRSLKTFCIPYSKMQSKWPGGLA